MGCLLRPAATVALLANTGPRSPCRQSPALPATRYFAQAPRPSALAALAAPPAAAGRRTTRSCESPGLRSRSANPRRLRARRHRAATPRPALTSTAAPYEQERLGGVLVKSAA